MGDGSDRFADGFPTSSDHALELPDGRTLAYRTCGCNLEDCSHVVLAFHGALGTGDFDEWSDVFRKHRWLVVSPTLPGWGLSSPSPGYTVGNYAATDVVHLVSHLLPVEGTPFMCLGISYGCIHAVACAAELPDRVEALCLLGPHGPFDDATFDPLQGMAPAAQLGLGWVGYWIPWLTRLTGYLVRKAVSTPDGARRFVEANLLEAMNDAERQQYATAPATLQEKVSSGRGLHRSLSRCLEGYVDIPRVLRSWSYQDLQKVVCPLHIFAAQHDVQAPSHAARYIHDKIAFSQLTVLEGGGHLSLVFSFAQCVEDFIRSFPTAGSQSNAKV